MPTFMDTRPCDDDPQENTTPGAHNDKHDREPRPDP